MNPCEGFTLVVDFELPLPQKGAAKSNIKLKDVLRNNSIRWTAKYLSAIRIPTVDFFMVFAVDVFCGERCSAAGYSYIGGVASRCLLSGNVVMNIQCCIFIMH